MRRLLFSCGLLMAVAGLVRAEEPKGFVKPASHQDIVQVPAVTVPPQALSMPPTIPPAPYTTSPTPYATPYIAPVPTLDSPLVPYGESKPARFPQTYLQAYPYVRPPVSPGHAFHSRLLDAYCAPDGCPTPLGCGNCYTDFIFVFGSCRQFFGTAESTVGEHRQTRVIQK